MCVKSIFVQHDPAVRDTDDEHASINIDQPRPSTKLHSTALKIEFDEKIEDAEAAAQFKGQSDTFDDQNEKEHWYNTDIHQLVHAEIAAFGVPNCPKIQSMIVNEISNYPAHHLFPVLCERVGAAIEDAFATWLLWSNEAAHQ